jgi:hypothetical protein
MELNIARYIIEKWEVGDCTCGAEPDLITRDSVSDANKHQVFLKCPECQKMVEGGTYLEHYNEGSVNARYKAIVECITAWENVNRPAAVEGISNYCRKCKSIDYCIDHATSYPYVMIRCPYYGSLKLCVERSKQ